MHLALLVGLPLAAVGYVTESVGDPLLRINSKEEWQTAGCLRIDVLLETRVAPGALQANIVTLTSSERDGGRVMHVPPKALAQNSW